MPFTVAEPAAWAVAGIVPAAARGLGVPFGITEPSALADIIRVTIAVARRVLGPLVAEYLSTTPAFVLVFVIVARTGPARSVIVLIAGTTAARFVIVIVTGAAAMPRFVVVIVAPTAAISGFLAIPAFVVALVIGSAAILISST
jgi:hypothetical protein